LRTDVKGERTSPVRRGVPVQSYEHLQNESGLVLKFYDRPSTTKARSPGYLQEGEHFLRRASRIQDETAKVGDRPSSTAFCDIGRNGDCGSHQLIAEAEPL